MLTRIVAAILFILLFPVIGFIALIIFLTDGSPILFVQKRVGFDGKSFCMYKFRTMVRGAQREKIKWQRDNPELWEEYEKNNFKLKNDIRVTKFGNFLRKTSLDELPQIINILKGEMAFIGPRPILLREKKYYGLSFRYYKKIKPGITGLWQVSGRSETTFQDRIKYDRYYVMNKSSIFDIWILCKTFFVLISRKGSY